jgi:hypothetical protein
MRQPCMGLGTAYREETLRMNNVLIKSFGGNKLCLWVEENCIFTEKILSICIYNYIKHLNKSDISKYCISMSIFHLKCY